MNNIFTFEKSRYSLSVSKLFMQLRGHFCRLFPLHNFHEFSFSVGIKYSIGEVDFLCRHQAVNQSVSLHTTPSETPLHVPATDDLRVHENVMHLPLTLLYSHLFNTGISKYKFALVRQIINKERWDETWHTLQICMPLSSFLKDVDLYHTVKGYYLS